MVTPLKDGSKLAGGKGLTLDRGHHVPRIVNWGSGRYKQHETNDLVDFTDILPTISDAIELKVPKAWDTDGVSNLPQIKGEKGTPRKWIFTHYSPIHSEGSNKNAARFFRDQRYKLYSDGRFYDLTKDIEEKNPLAAGKSDPEGEKMRKVFQGELARLPAWKFGDPGVAKVILPGLEPDPGFAEKGD